MINFELDDSGLTFLDSLDKYEPDKVKPRVLSDNNIEDPSYALSLRLSVRVLNVIVFLTFQILLNRKVQFRVLPLFQYNDVFTPTSPSSQRSSQSRTASSSGYYSNTPQFNEPRGPISPWAQVSISFQNLFLSLSFRRLTRCM